jgi:hypothetical protein
MTYPFRNKASTSKYRAGMRGPRGGARRFFTVLHAVAIAAFGSLDASAVRAAPSTEGNNVLLVVRLQQKDHPTDENIRRHLEARGFKVTMVDQYAPIAALSGENLVVISSTVSGRDLGDKYRDTTLPVVTWEDSILDVTGMTGRKKDADWGSVEKEHYLWIVNAPHPLAGGLPAGKLFVYPSDGPMAWGKPGLGASIIATLPGEPDKAAIFGYEKGATMNYDALAPARRVMLFLQNDSFDKLSPSGLKLFDAAVTWAIEKP